MAYCWYRCSKGFDAAMPFEEKLKACLFLCETENKQCIGFLPQGWQQAKGLSLADKYAILQKEGILFNIEDIALFHTALSGGITKEEWRTSMLSQPFLFIRLRKHKDKALQLLRDNAIDYSEDGNCIGIKNGTAIEKILPADWYVVQDASSQHTGSFFNPEPRQEWWDCCSGAGGKSLLLSDKQPKVHLTVSDKRSSILHNLSERFRQYGYISPRQLVLDTADAGAVQHALGNTRFARIICDVPCTGSGTWARTPEQLYFFNEAAIATISALQAAIAINASKYLKAGGLMYYITCSVFEAENEAVVTQLQQQGMKLQDMVLVNGIGQKADSMFIAVLQK